MRTVSIFLLSLLTFVADSPAQGRLPTFDATVVEYKAEYEIEEGASECSFYCANFTHTERASSVLPRRGKLRYGATQAHDSDLNTAWVEGSEGDGIGEFLEYIIDTSEREGGEPLKVTGLHIYNGYRKSRESWRDNSRVKRLKLYVNGRPHAIINLMDAYNYQAVELGSIELRAKKTVLRFEIMEVYKGRKYSDTAIAEIELNGCCAH